MGMGGSRPISNLGRARWEMGRPVFAQVRRSEIAGRAVGVFESEDEPSWWRWSREISCHAPALRWYFPRLTTLFPNAPRPRNTLRTK